MRQVIRGLAGAAVLGAASGVSRAGVPTLYGPGQTAGAYDGSLRVTTFASGLNYPTSMQAYGPTADHGLLVGTTTGGPFYSGATAGHLLYLTDANHDGVADGGGVDLTPTGGIPGSITSVRQAGDLLLVTSNVTSSTPTISVLRAGATPTSPFTTVGAMTLNFPANFEHESYALAVRPTAATGQYDVLFNIGSEKNDVSTATTVRAATAGNVGGFTAATLQPESIYLTTLTDTKTAATLTAPTLVAKGLRNAAGLAFDPRSGALYFDDNGMDGTVANGHPDDRSGNVAYSLDTLHRIAAADVGTAVPDYQFSKNFVENDAAHTVHGTPNALAYFAPLDDSRTEESEGPNEIAIAPSGFPAGLNDGVFLGFHGQFDKVGNPDPTTGQGNEEHPVVFYDDATGQYFHFVDNTNADVTIGHLDGLLATDDALYMADLTGAGSLFGGATNTGAIYMVQAVPEPETTAGLVVAAALLRRGRRR